MHIVLVLKLGFRNKIHLVVKCTTMMPIHKARQPRKIRISGDYSVLVNLQDHIVILYLLGNH